MSQYEIVNEMALLAGVIAAEKTDQEKQPAFESTNEPQLFLRVAADIESAVESIKYCACSTRWVDTRCIWRVINLWVPLYPTLCSGCYYLRPSQTHHRCMGYLTATRIPHSKHEVDVEFFQHTMDIMKDPQTLKELFTLYITFHYSETMLKRNFELGLRRIANTELAKLKDVLLQKDKT